MGWFIGIESLDLIKDMRKVVWFRAGLLKRNKDSSNVSKLKESSG